MRILDLHGPRIFLNGVTNYSFHQPPISWRVLVSLKKVLLTACYDRTPITRRGVVKQQSFHARTK